jgi:hypothetical protein
MTTQPATTCVAYALHTGRIYWYLQQSISNDRFFTAINPLEPEARLTNI